MNDKNEYIPHWDCALVYKVGDKVIWTDDTLKECSGSSWVEPQVYEEYSTKEDNDAI